MSTIYWASDGLTHPGCVRSVNEDAFLSMPEYGVWAVADGMGGHNAGDLASQLIIDMIEKSVVESGGGGSIIIAVQRAIQAANAQLRDYSLLQLDGDVVGSTLVILIIMHGHYHVFWAGDSRLYLLRHSVLSQVTRDHSEVMDLVDEGLVDLADAESHPLSNVVTRAVGGDEHIQLDYFYGGIESGDQFFICSDGVNKVINDEELREIFMQDSGLKAGNESIYDYALERNAPDNFTSVIVKLSNEEQLQDKTINSYLG